LEHSIIVDPEGDRERIGVELYKTLPIWQALML